MLGPAEGRRTAAGSHGGAGLGSARRHHGQGMRVPMPALDRSRPACAKSRGPHSGSRSLGDAARLCWCSADLFGCDPTRPFGPLDKQGLLWALHRDPIIALAQDTATGGPRCKEDDSMVTKASQAGGEKRDPQNAPSRAAFSPLQNNIDLIPEGRRLCSEISFEFVQFVGRHHGSERIRI
jgi:hypothetical protein